MYAANYFALGMVMGFSKLDEPIQSFGSFADSPYALKLYQLFIIVLVGKILAIAAIGYIFWIIENIFSNPAFSILAAAAAAGLEYTAYKKFPDEILGNFNIFSMLEPESVFITYRNINIFGEAVSAVTVVLRGAVVFFVLCAAFAAAAAAKKRLVKTRKYVRLSVTLPGMPVIGVKSGEFCRFFIKLGAGFFLAASIIIIPSMYKSEVTYTTFWQLVQRHYENLAGEYSEDCFDYLADEKQKIDDDMAALEEAVVKNQDYYQSIGYQSTLNYIKLRQEAYDYVENEAERLAADAAEGYFAAFVFTYEYQQIFEITQAQDEWVYVLMILLTVVGCGGIYAYDRQNNMTRLIKTSVIGERKIRQIRRNFLVIYVIIMWAAGFAAQWRDVTNINGFEGSNFNLRNLSLFADTEWGISIKQAFVLMWLLRLAGLMIILCVVVFISKKARDIKTAYAVQTLLTALPAALSVTGVELMNFFSVLELVKADTILRIMAGC